MRFITTNYDKVKGIEPEVHIEIYKDASCNELLARHIGSLENGRDSLIRTSAPFVFKDINNNSVYVMFTSNGVGSINIYNLHLKALLDTSRLKLPLLKTGVNILRYTDAEYSSHQAKVKVIWQAP